MRVIKNDSVPPPVCQFHLVCAAPNKCVWQFVRLFYRANFADRGTLLHDTRTDCSVGLTLLPCMCKLPPRAYHFCTPKGRWRFRHTYHLGKHIFSTLPAIFVILPKVLTICNPIHRKTQPTGQRIFHVWTIFFFFLLLLVSSYFQSERWVAI